MRKLTNTKKISREDTEHTDCVPASLWVTARSWKVRKSAESYEGQTLASAQLSLTALSCPWNSELLRLWKERERKGIWPGWPPLLWFWLPLHGPFVSFPWGLWSHTSSYQTSWKTHLQRDYFCKHNSFSCWPVSLLLLLLFLFCFFETGSM
jgi:hypothetical protein